MPLYGYARVSTTDQNVGLQQAALKAASCEVICAEKVMGTAPEGPTRTRHPSGLRARRRHACGHPRRPAGPLIGDLQDVVGALKAKGAALQAFETNLRRERQMEGLTAAKARGVYAGKGRRYAIDPVEVRCLREEEKLGPAATAKRLKIGRASVCRLLAETAV